MLFNVRDMSFNLHVVGFKGLNELPVECGKARRWEVKEEKSIAGVLIYYRNSRQGYHYPSKVSLARVCFVAQWNKGDATSGLNGQMLKFFSVF